MDQHIAAFFEALKLWYVNQLPGDVMAVTRYCRHKEPLKIDQHRLDYQNANARERLCRYCEDAQHVRPIGQHVRSLDIDIVGTITAYRMVPTRAHHSEPEYSIQTKSDVFFRYESEIK